MNWKTTSKIKISLLLFLFLAFLNITLTSRLNPPASFEALVTGNGGCTCHGGAQASTVVNVTGLPTAATGYTLGMSYPIQVTVTGNGTASGFLLIAAIGTLSTSDPNVNVGSASSIFHAAPLVETGGVSTFNATWTAPASGGAVANFQLYGNSVNQNFNTGGDAWNTMTINIPLPVHFVNFDVFNTNNNAQISFETEKEENIDRFEIERSFDAINFERIHSLDPINNGIYNYTDRTVSNNVKYYYRIKEVDIDNKFSYSAVRDIVLSTSDLNVKLYPTHVNHQVINIKGLKNYDGLNLEVYSINGLQVANLNNENNQFYLNDLSNGSYIVRLMRNNNVLKTQKITISN